MKAQSRDKVALLVFFAMVALAIGGLVGYLMIGHNWNVAASNIDDAAGSMDGYTTIIYEGTVDPAIKRSAEKESESDPGTDPEFGANETEQDDSIFPPASSGSDENVGSLEDGSDLGAEQPDGEEANESENTEIKTVETIKPIDIEEVITSYQDKKSTVFKLDVAHGISYEDGMILKKGQKRIVVFNVLETDTAFKIERQIDNLEKYNPDYLIAIVPDSRLVKTVPGIDIVISTAPEDLFVMGETIDGTFYVSAPTLGSVGAIIISPSGVVSAKVLSDS